MFPDLMPRLRPHKLAWAAPQSIRAAQSAVSNLAMSGSEPKRRHPGKRDWCMESGELVAEKVPGAWQARQGGVPRGMIAQQAGAGLLDWRRALRNPSPTCP